MKTNIILIAKVRKETQQLLRYNSFDIKKVQ